jgi:hypothetical protein
MADHQGCATLLPDDCRSHEGASSLQVLKATTLLRTNPESVGTVTLSAMLSDDQN